MRYLAYFCINEIIDILFVSQSLEWRKKWDADNLLEWDPPQIFKDYLPYGLSGFDKDGAPGKIYRLNQVCYKIEFS